MKKDEPISEAVNGILDGIWKFLVTAVHGVRRLKRLGPLAAFILCLGICVGAALLQAQILGVEAIGDTPLPLFARYLAYWLLLLAPLICLAVLGTVQDKKNDVYETIFQEINFMGKDKKYPHLVSKKQDGKKTILTFRSNIPLAEWTKAKASLETGLDCNIRQLQEGVDKKSTILVTVPSDYKIPTKVPWNDGYMREWDGEVVLGESDLEQVSFDLNRVPHVLAAGETGSGKSVILRLILWQLINQGCSVYMIDFKGGVEFGKAYERYGEVITERERAVAVLEMLVKENEARLKLFRELEVKNLWEYNHKTGSNLCRVAVVIDEIAEMLDRKGVPREEKPVYEQLEKLLSTLARLSRATGINLLLGVQRPDANVLTGQIKNNVPVRISGHFIDKAASEIVLGSPAATTLPDIKGRFLYKVGNEEIEFQAYFFDDEKNLHEVVVEPGKMLTAKQRGTPATPAQRKEDAEPLEPWEDGPPDEPDFDFDFDEIDM